MRRRDFLIGATAITSPTLACAQGEGGTTKRPLIGILALNDENNEWIRAFIEALEKLGYVNGRTVVITAHYAGGNPAVLRELAADLALRKPDVIMADVASAIKAALKAAPGVPIVGAAMGSPVQQGLATSFAHPSGNVTGIASQVEEMNAKLVEIGLEMFPGTNSFGVLLNPEGDNARLYRRELQAAAEKRRIVIHVAEARDASEIENAMHKLADARVAFVLVQPNGLLNTERRRVAELAISARLPAFSPYSRNGEAGDLLTYGVDYLECYRRAAFFVDKILKGANAGDLPIEFPTKIEMSVNLKTAKALGINVPQSLLLRVDHVIE
jgi:putative ABC transport system substrate-binding protein